jgi:hypothetical protein
LIKKALLGGLLPFITNPVALTIIGIGAAGYALYDISSEEDEQKAKGPYTTSNAPEPSNEPFTTVIPTVNNTVCLPLEAVEPTVEDTVTSTAEEPLEHDYMDIQTSEEKRKKEVIRQAMSELGKRSAAARKAKHTT